jgi:hypothetical protein
MSETLAGNRRERGFGVCPGRVSESFGVCRLVQENEAAAAQALLNQIWAVQRLASLEMSRFQATLY